MKAFNITGQKFGRLTAVRRAENHERYKQARWLFNCDCGNEKVIFGYLVWHNKVKSCGCWQIDHPSRLVHGMVKSREFHSWAAMRQRCNNPSCAAFMDYGGRGITVCDEWAAFEQFYADMGPRPNGTSLERVDNDKGYSKANCVWGTKAAQVRNRRVTIRYDDGDGLRSLAELADKYGLPYKTVWHRHKVGRKGAELFAPVSHGGDRRSGEFTGKQRGFS